MYAAYLIHRVLRMRPARIFGIFAVGWLVVAAPAMAETHQHPATAPARVSPYLRAQRSSHAEFYYATNWGVDHLQARKTSSGSLIRFSYRVVNAVLAKPLHEKKAEPHMIGLRTHAVLTVPTMENVGQL